MSTVEQEIVNKLHHLSDDKQQKVLDFIETLEQSSSRSLSARDLMKLPVDERNRLVSQSLELSANEDFETFEAYSEEGFNDEP